MTWVLFLFLGVYTYIPKAFKFWTSNNNNKNKWCISIAFQKWSSSLSFKNNATRQYCQVILRFYRVLPPLYTFINILDQHFMCDPNYNYKSFSRLIYLNIFNLVSFQFQFKINVREICTTKFTFFTIQIQLIGRPLRIWQLTLKLFCHVLSFAKYVYSSRS